MYACGVFYSLLIFFSVRIYLSWRTTCFLILSCTSLAVNFSKVPIPHKALKKSSLCAQSKTFSKSMRGRWNGNLHSAHCCTMIQRMLIGTGVQFLLLMMKDLGFPIYTNEWKYQPCRDCRGYKAGSSTSFESIDGKVCYSWFVEKKPALMDTVLLRRTLNSTSCAFP